ncbi:MAG: hypothetical protein QGI11_12795, partial [Nitrospinota bacterium]|nr:hypothetical protein [Nitrospinota bacterium]
SGIRNVPNFTIFVFKPTREMDGKSGSAPPIVSVLSRNFALIHFWVFLRFSPFHNIQSTPTSGLYSDWT